MTLRDTTVEERARKRGEDARAPAPAGLLPPFRPRFPWLTADLQTVRNTIRRPRDKLSDHSCEDLWFPMPDGSGDVLHGALSRPEKRTGKPLVILIHGLTGCQDSFHVRVSAGHLLASGHPVMRLNLRSAGPTRGLCAEQYHAGRTEDLAAVLGQLPEGLTRNGVAAVGYSLGGSMLLKYLGEAGEAARIGAAVSVSAPIDLAGTSRHFHRPRNRIYVSYLLRYLKSDARAARGGVPARFERALARARTIVDYDEGYIAPRYGFASAADYYAKSSALPLLDAVRVPTLVLHAADDPWIGDAAYRSHDWRRNPALRLALTDKGGHVGFHGAGAAMPYHDRLVARFLGGSLCIRQAADP